MKEISIEKKFDLYMDTLEKCGLHLLDVSDEMIEYYIFEEFDIGAITFLYKDNIQKLMDEGLIDEEIYSSSQILRKKFMDLQETDLWNIISVKEAPEWKEILQLSDEIKYLVHQKWTTDELEVLRGNELNKKALQNNSTLK